MDEFEAMLRKQEELASARLGGFATTAERNASIVDEYKAGANSNQIAKKYAISRQRVWQILKQRDVVPHSKLAPDAETIFAVAQSDCIGTIRGLATRMNVTMSVVRSRLRRSERWPEMRKELSTLRLEASRRVLRERTLNTYRAFVATLGRPASIKEMAQCRIYATTLQRLYGAKYVSKFREDVGEVG